LTAAAPGRPTWPICPQSLPWMEARELALYLKRAPLPISFFLKDRAEYEMCAVAVSRFLQEDKN